MKGVAKNPQRLRGPPRRRQANPLAPPLGEGGWLFCDSKGERPPQMTFHWSSLTPLPAVLSFSNLPLFCANNDHETSGLHLKSHDDR